MWTESLHMTNVKWFSSYSITVKAVTSLKMLGVISNIGLKTYHQVIHTDF